MSLAAARAALARGDFDTVIRHAGPALAATDTEAESRFLLGVVAAERGQIADAIAQIEAAVMTQPRGEYRAQLARLYALARRDGDAAAQLAAIERDPPADALSRDTIGCVYARLGNHEAALPHFVAAVALAPDNDSFLYNQAATLSFLGRADEAEAALERLLARSPDHARGHHLLAGLCKQSEEHHHIPRLREAQQRARGTDRLLTGYALAKELEDVGRADEALACLLAVNAEHRRTIGYDPARDSAIVDAVIANWPAMAASPAIDCPEAAPILIIGMPRTGTTLVDRILAAHPAVESLGELQALPLAVKAASGTRSRNVLDVETLAAVTGVGPGVIGHDYLARAAHHRRRNDLRFVDKFPGNFHYAGIAARALPNAAIVCLRRNPMDTVLANFRNLFAIGSRYYDYSYDLLDIAEYVAGFERLMSFWRAELPGRILDLHYEDLVADQEGETRRLLAHCGLEWSERCLDFHAQGGAVSTPSAAQVRRPIYRDSVARWRRHEAVLAPVAAFFAARGIAID
ncbi:sulfotransferase family protein [Sphingomonas sp. RS6]